MGSGPTLMIGDVMGSATAVGFVMALFLAVVFITDGGGSFHPGPAECGGSIGLLVGGAPVISMIIHDSNIYPVLNHFRKYILSDKIPSTAVGFVNCFLRAPVQWFNCHAALCQKTRLTPRNSFPNLNRQFSLSHIVHNSNFQYT